jgi:UDP-N-acetylglucosamine 2-epimerase (non-hydrolysing)
MTNRQNILLVFGTRPEAIKLAPVALALAADSRFNLSVCSTGQHRDMVRPVCELFGLQVDHDLDLMVPGQTIDHVTTATLSKLPAIFEQVGPDKIIVQGDTSTAFAAGLSAFFHKIPIAHVEAGLRTHDIRSPWPEEGNRALLSRIADYHFAPTLEARANLERENVGGEIVVTGNTVVDAAQIAARRIAGVKGLQIATRLRISTTDRKKILFTMHRRESFGEPVESVFHALRTIAETNDVDILFPVHPNPNIAGPAQRILGRTANVRLLPPLAYDEMIYVLNAAHLLITDSGGLAEEAPTFGKPTLILRESTERPECVASGNALLLGYDTERLQSLVTELLGSGERYRAMSTAANPFGDGQASSRIVDALAGKSIPLAAAA